MRLESPMPSHVAVVERKARDIAGPRGKDIQIGEVSAGQRTLQLRIALRKRGLYIGSGTEVGASGTVSVYGVRGSGNSKTTSSSRDLSASTRASAKSRSRCCCCTAPSPHPHGQPRAPSRAAGSVGSGWPPRWRRARQRPPCAPPSTPHCESPTTLATSPRRATSSSARQLPARPRPGSLR